MIHACIHGWMSQVRGMTRRSGTNFLSTCPFGGRSWLNGALVNGLRWTLWLTGSLDLNVTVCSWTTAVTYGRNSQFFWSMTTTGVLSTSALSASGFVPWGRIRYANANLTLLVLGSTTRLLSGIGAEAA